MLKNIKKKQDHNNYDPRLIYKGPFVLHNAYYYVT